MPGLKVVAPWSSADAKGLLRAAIRDPNPVIVLENEILYGQTFDCPVDEDFILPIGKREGRTHRQSRHHRRLLHHGRRRHEGGGGAGGTGHRGGGDQPALAASAWTPQTIVDSVKKTSRLVTVEEGWPFAGIGAEVAMQVIEHAFDWLDAPPVRVHGVDVPLPYAANLEKLALPQPEWVVDAVKKIV